MKTELYINMVGEDPNGVCTTQTPAATGVQNLTIAGALATAGIATMDIARKIILTCAGSDAARIFRITGTDRNNNVLVEAILGSAGSTTVTKNDFKTITQITVDDDTAGAVIVGTNQQASTKWVTIDRYQHANKVLLSAEVLGDIVIGPREKQYKCTVANTSDADSRPLSGAQSDMYWEPLSSKITNISWETATAYVAAGTLTYKVEYTLDNIRNLEDRHSAKVYDHDDPNLVSKTTSEVGNIAYPVTAVRLTLTAYTSGGVRFKVRQSGI